MNLVHLGINPAQNANSRYSASPQLLASILARLSRSAKTTTELIAEIGGDDESTKVESMLKWIDYGHSSIADNAPICVVLEDISELMAYFILNKCQLAGAIQQSTRYIRFDATAEELTNRAMTAFGVHEGFPHWASKENCVNTVQSCYAEYLAQVELWSKNVPSAITSEPNAKKRDTYIRNYALDRARYALPLCHPTTLGLVMSGREWTKLVVYLLSAPPQLKEATLLGTRLKQMLGHLYPQLLKLDRMVGSEAECDAQWWAVDPKSRYRDPVEKYKTPVSWDKELVGNYNLNRKTRFDPIPTWLGTYSTTMSFERLDFGVIRELNRHRTGTRYTLFGKPHFELPLHPERGRGVATEDFTENYLDMADSFQKSHDPSRLYFMPMSIEFPWAHTTTVDKLIYQIEIRCTKEAHFAARSAMGAVGDWLDEFYPGLLHEGWKYLGTG